VNNRYYSNAYGRFMTPDPYMSDAGRAGNPGDPGSWNKYAYTRGDPVNRFDPAGTCDQSADTDYSITVCADIDTSDSVPPGDITFIQNGAYTRGMGSQQMAFETAMGMMNAWQALFQFERTNFSQQCQNFINNTLGAGALQTLQKDALSTSIVNAADVSTPAGTTLFPTDPTDAANTQNLADQKTGIAGTSLATLAFFSPTTYAWGQWNGSAIFINNASS
jgi:RHS repeat-associated protein